MRKKNGNSDEFRRVSWYSTTKLISTKSRILDLKNIHRKYIYVCKIKIRVKFVQMIHFEFFDNKIELREIVHVPRQN